MNPSPPRPTDSSPEEIEKVLANKQGVVSAHVDVPGEKVELDYDPQMISDAEVEALINHVAPAVQKHFKKYIMRLTGRAAEATAMRLEDKAKKIPGIKRATATFLGGVMNVTYDTSILQPSEVIEKVKKIGAPVKPYESFITEEKVWWKKFFHRENVEIFFTFGTLISLGLGWLAPRIGWSSLAQSGCYGLAYVFGGYFGIQASWQSLKEKTVNVDLLMLLAALGAAYVGAPMEGAVLLFLFSFSNVLQGYAMDRTRKAIQSLMQLRPETALVRRNGKTEVLPIESLQVGDRVIVRPGESVPLDGTIVEGSSDFDESSLTGESMPVYKEMGQHVFAGSINQTGAIEFHVTRLAKDSTLARLIQLVEEAQSERAKTQRFLDKAEQFYALGVIAFTIALIVIPTWFLKENFSSAFYRAMTVMVVASPCALIISTPASILSAIGCAARKGVLFKGGAHLERCAEIKIVALDKTGTLTEGKPRVTDVATVGKTLNFPGAKSCDEVRLLSLAASVEAKSEHPLGQAILKEAQRRSLQLFDATHFQSISGKGANATVNGERIAVGSPRFFEQFHCPEREVALKEVARFQDEGKTAVLVGKISEDGAVVSLLGAIAIADVLREDAPKVVQQLKALGIKQVVMVTGDNPRVAAAIARQAGVDEFYADLLPQDKVLVLRDLRKMGEVAMVGDGVNDAPALASASIGVAMGAAGTDVAMETADVVLMSDNLKNIPFAIQLSRQAKKIVYQNLTFALGVIVVLVISALGFQLPLPLGVVGHEGSTVLVCLNGLRLLAFRVKD
ncbi:MAG: heavy metal translocating P-type ATPase [Verrucomicrobiia bacterium]